MSAKSNTEKKENRNILNILKNSGFKVKIQHIRYIKENGGLLPMPISFYKKHYPAEERQKFIVEPRRGITYVTVYYPENHTNYTACSICHKNDNFNYTRGLHICLERIKKRALLNVE